MARITCAGLGPGDPELMSLKAARAVQRARHVAYFRKKGATGRARATAAGMLRPDVTEHPMEYPVTTELPFDSPAYGAALAAFYDSWAERLADLAAAAGEVVVLCEGDPFFYGSFMHLYVRLKARVSCCGGHAPSDAVAAAGAAAAAPVVPARDSGPARPRGAPAAALTEALTEAPTEAPELEIEVIPGITGMSACWTATGRPITWGDDTLTVCTATLPRDVLAERARTADALVVMKIGRNLDRLKAALADAGRLDAAWLVSEGALPGQKVMPLAEAAGPVPYFSIALVHGRGRRP